MINVLNILLVTIFAGLIIFGAVVTVMIQIDTVKKNRK